MAKEKDDAAAVDAPKDQDPQTATPDADKPKRRARAKATADDDGEDTGEPVARHAGRNANYPGMAKALRLHGFGRNPQRFGE